VPRIRSGTGISIIIQHRLKINMYWNPWLVSEVLPNAFSTYSGIKITPGLSPSSEDWGSTQFAPRFTDSLRISLRGFTCQRITEIFSQQVQVRHSISAVQCSFASTHLEAGRKLRTPCWIYSETLLSGNGSASWEASSLHVIPKNFPISSYPEWLRAVRFEGKNHCPVEASTRIRLLIYTGTPIQINS
jgi:hypothetical protein